MIVTAFSRSELFKIFFKMVFGIVTLGLIHGLIFLPVFLAGKLLVFLSFIKNYRTELLVLLENSTKFNPLIFLIKSLSLCANSS